ncbi:MAG: DNA alkylation repair protein [Anaerolineales bacterium]
MTKDEVLTYLKRRGTKRNIEALARYGIQTDRALGVTMGTLLALAKRLGKDHNLAAELWDSGWYEARLLAALVDDPRLVTRRQMNAWAADFDNWAVCDTAVFHLFDRSPFAWEKVRQWSTSPREFVKRASFWMMTSLSVHDKAASHARFLALLPLIEKGARDERNFVKKAVSSALRTIGKRTPALHAASLKLAQRLSRSTDPGPRWVGKDALRELARPMVRTRLAKPVRRS